MAKRKVNKSPEASTTGARDFAVSARQIPAISVIMPLYNVENYVGEALDSVIAQTFQDFEVIVVDDCSTDSSPAIVESYKDKFGGRLRLAQTKKNSGGCAVPRNVGLPFSRGEYIFFMDSDDIIKPTAFEELYALAKKFDADVVHCEKCYQVVDKNWNDAEYRENLKPSSYTTGNKILIREPLLLTDNFVQRAIEFSRKWLTWSIWLQLIRRDFIFENELLFGDFMREDLTFTICEICCAKRYLVVPNVVYYYRKREGSIVHAGLNVPQLIKTEIRALKRGIQYLEEFFSSSEIFSQRPDLKYTLFDMFTQEILTRLNSLYAQIPPHEIDVILRYEFGDNKDALTPFMFSAMNSYRLQLLQSFGHIAELENKVRRLTDKGVNIHDKPSETKIPPPQY